MESHAVRRSWQASEDEGEEGEEEEREREDEDAIDCQKATHLKKSKWTVIAFCATFPPIYVS
jgi:hypothetical protein